MRVLMVLLVIGVVVLALGAMVVSDASSAMQAQAAVEAARAAQAAEAGRAVESAARLAWGLAALGVVLMVGVGLVVYLVRRGRGAGWGGNGARMGDRVRVGSDFGSNMYQQLLMEEMWERRRLQERLRVEELLLAGRTERPVGLRFGDGREQGERAAEGQGWEGWRWE